MSVKLLIFGLVALAAICPLWANPVGEPPKTVCYYESWAHWRAGDGKMDLSDIDSSQCTHLVYSFLGIKKDTFEVAITDPYLMNDLHDLEQFPQHKGEAKALLAVGGPSASDEFTEMVKTDASRTAFARSVVNLVEQYNYDGILLHWFHYDISSNYHSAGLLELLKQFHNETFARRYTLAIAVSASDWYAEDKQDMPKIAELVDFITVLTFDMNPFYAGILDQSPLYWQFETAEKYHKMGVPRAKLIITVPLFARTWRTTHNQGPTQVRDDYGNPLETGPAGPASKVAGYLSYNELCTMMSSNPQLFAVTFNPYSFTVTATVYNATDNTIEYFSYENRKTLGWKARNITASGFAGIAVYALDNDDFRGNCGIGKYPLMQAINQNYVAPEKPEEEVVIVTEQPKTTAQAPFEHIKGMVYCRQLGKFRDHANCSKWYSCDRGEFEFFTIELTVFYCREDQAFDEWTRQCVPRSQVPACQQTSE